MARRSTWLLGTLFPVVLGAGLVGATAAPAAAANAREWAVDVGPIGRSSPMAVDLDGNGDLEIVVGSQDANLYALRANGTRLWTASALKPIESSPAAADTDGDGRPEVFVGSGSSLKANLQGGRLHSYTAAGVERPGWPNKTNASAGEESAMIESTPAIGDTTNDGMADVVVGTSGLAMPSYSQNGVRNWEQNTDDSVTSSPALADVNGDGVTDVVIGGDSAAGGTVDINGGVIRAFDGRTGRVIWQQLVNEVVTSSPAIGDIDGDGTLDIVVASGSFYNNATSDDLRILDLATGNIEQKFDLIGAALGGPTLADVDGNSVLDVVMGTMLAGGFSRIWVFNGNGTQQTPYAGGKTIAGHHIEGSIVAAQLDGQPGQDLVVATTGGPWAFSGSSGATILESMWNRERFTTVRMQNSPLIADLDRDGRLDIVLAGQRENGTGVIERYEIDGGSIGATSWPMFHRDNRRTGNVAGVPLVRTFCNQPGGYWMVARDGGIFAFCDARFHGSAGGTPLNQPIVGMAATPDGGGYWLVAADGGIFAYGNAAFHGSAGGTPLNQPIVGMARTRSGRGYWLVARDGGIFAYGDAAFRGSTGGTPLNQPIVGMAASTTGDGYYLVARDGGIFAFGSGAPFHGSTGSIRLNQPIVGMALAPNGGYWLVASDGGIFAFPSSTPFHGSTGSIRLNQPIVGMTPTPSGNGYYLVASDGGIFAFPNTTPFFGSTGAIRLNQPIVGIALPR